MARPGGLDRDLETGTSIHDPTFEGDSDQEQEVAVLRTERARIFSDAFERGSLGGGSGS